MIFQCSFRVHCKIFGAYFWLLSYSFASLNRLRYMEACSWKNRAEKREAKFYFQWKLVCCIRSLVAWFIPLSVAKFSWFHVVIIQCKFCRAIWSRRSRPPDLFWIELPRSKFCLHTTIKTNKPAQCLDGDFS